jgi:hypothetical protein
MTVAVSQTTIATSNMLHWIAHRNPAKPRAPAKTAAPAPVTLPAPPVACEGVDVADVLVLLVVPAAVVLVDVVPALEMRSAEVDTGISTGTVLSRGVAEGVGVAVWRMRETEREYC